jgi:chemosensory pili system protein ChpA (sensor histidine kinase/response regulator)
MAVEGVTAVSSSQTRYDLFERARTEQRARVDRTQSDPAPADDQKLKQTQDGKKAEQERAQKLQLEREVRRAEEKKEAETQKAVELEVQRAERRRAQAQQVEADRRERIEVNNAAEDALKHQAERARVEGLNAYRAQSERLQATSFSDRTPIQSVRVEPAKTVRDQLSQIETNRMDTIKLSDIARARLQGAVGLQILT